MKNVTVILLLLALALPTFAAAKSKGAQINEPAAPPEMVLAIIAEVEPNDNAATASGPLVGGDQGTGAVSPSGDADYWTLNVTVTGLWTLGTAAGSAPIISDTIITLYGPDGTTQLASDDDSGPGLYSLISYNFAATGTYYVKVVGYSSNTGGYVLNVGSPLPPPPNDTCGGAIALPFTEGYSVAATTAGAMNDYDPGASGCTGYAAVGGDIVYAVTLEPEQEIILVWDPESFDASLYVVTDCADMTTCVAGADEGVGGGAETVGFMNTTGVPTTYYIICDAYSGSGPATLTILAAVATEATTWSTVKALHH